MSVAYQRQAASDRTPRSILNPRCVPSATRRRSRMRRIAATIRATVIAACASFAPEGHAMGPQRTYRLGVAGRNCRGGDRATGSRFTTAPCQHGPIRCGLTISSTTPGQRAEAQMPHRDRRVHPREPRHRRAEVSAPPVIDVLTRLVSVHGAPMFLRSDNGPEFISNGSCVARRGQDRHRPDRSRQTLAERRRRDFNGKFRDSA